MSIVKRSARLRHSSLASAVKANLGGLLLLHVCLLLLHVCYFLCIHKCLHLWKWCECGIGVAPVVPSCPAALQWSHRGVRLPPFPGATWDTPVANRALQPPSPRLTKPGSSHLFPVTWGSTCSLPRKVRWSHPKFPITRFTSSWDCFSSSRDSKQSLGEHPSNTHSVNRGKAFFPPYEGVFCNSPAQKILIHRLFKCGKNGNSLNYVDWKLGHGQNILLRKIQFHRNAGMQEQDPDHRLTGEFKKNILNLLPPSPNTSSC